MAMLWDTLPRTRDRTKSPRPTIVSRQSLNVQRAKSEEPELPKNIARLLHREFTRGPSSQGS